MPLSQIPYEGTVIRPPNEGESVIVQVTLGCSDNRCVFCPAYKDKPFRVRDLADIGRDLRTAARLYPHARRLFFADGDALIAPQELLRAALEIARGSFPRLSRVGMYGSIRSVASKPIADLRELRAQKLGTVYVGLETGDEETYRFICKHGSVRENIETCQKLGQAGIPVNATVILGLGGRENSIRHAENTARMLNAARPGQIAALTLMVAPGTPLHELQEKGDFVAVDEFGLIEELRTLIRAMDDFPCQFYANHASNYVPIAARFPKDRPAVLALLAGILSRRDKNLLRPEHLRGL